MEFNWVAKRNDWFQHFIIEIFKNGHQIHSFYRTKMLFTNKFNVRVPQTYLKGPIWQIYKK